MFRISRQTLKLVVLGFTGGIASGKTSRCEHLLKLAKQKADQRHHSFGVFGINADTVAHRVYDPGTVAYDKIVQRFGAEIVNRGNEDRIDRKKLGAIVFADEEKLQDLNRIMWPEIDKALLAEVDRCYELSSVKEGNRLTLVILEAAILIEQGFVRHCRDVWLTSCEPEEAIRRSAQRDGLSEQEARRRVLAQWTIARRLDFLKNAGFQGDVRHFDTTHCETLAAGLKEISVAFTDYWENNLLKMF